MELVFIFNRDTLEDVKNSNINDNLPGKNNLLWLSKSSALVFQLKKAISLLFRLLSNNIRTTSSKANNLSIFLLDNLSPKLLPNIMLHN